METIFRGLLQSSYKGSFKRAFLEKTVLASAENVDTEPTDPTTGLPACHRIFDASLDIAGRLQSPDDTTEDSDASLCYAVFNTWAQYHAAHLQTFLNAAAMRRYLSSADYAANRRIIFKMLVHAVQVLGCNTDVSDLVVAVRDASPSLLLDDDRNLDLATELLAFWSQFVRDFEPDGERLAEVTKALLRALSRCDVATLTTVNGVATVADFVGYVWAHCDATVVRECLTEIYKILSSAPTASAAGWSSISSSSEPLSSSSASSSVSSQFREPSQCLAAVAQYIPLELLENVCKSMVLTNGVTAAMTLQLVLCRVVDWLQWPAVKNVDVIIMSIMKMLENNKSYAILFLVTQMKAEQTFLLLKCEPMREACLNVVMYMLLAYQHSPDVFHKVILKVPEVLLCLREENSEQSLAVAGKVTAMVFALIQLHSGFPEIYDPILPALQDVSSEYVKMIQDYMATNKWGSFGLNYSSQSLALQPKSTTGKVGLLNLGNTCYMNSVLQAVYMNDEFRYRVLTAILAPRQQLLFQLQRVFTFLTHSERPSYSPKGFLQASKPPWFDVGRQQDCSEFLRHFFDSMHEQECVETSSLRCFPPDPSQSTPVITGGSSSQDSTTTSGSGSSSTQQSDDTNSTFLSDSTTPSSSSSASSPSSAAAAAGTTTTAQCLIHDLFSGQLSTSYRCLQCQQVSVQREAFIDLSLALPDAAQSKYIQKKELKAGRAEPADSEVHLGECSSSTGSGGGVGGPGPGPAQLLDVTDDTDILGGTGVGADDEDLRLEDLIRYYISPEKLEGENRYFCANCDQLQEAQKTIRITAAPQYLTCTILRFAYDVQSQRRVKILRNVVYPEVLSIPVTGAITALNDDKDTSIVNAGATTTSGSTTSGSVDQGRPHQYALYAVVVHSGASSDCGHYYTYACRSEALPDAFGGATTTSATNVEGAVGNTTDESPDLAETTAESTTSGCRRVWYLFNDSRVTYSEYQSVANLSQRFARDTAYLLFYRRVGGGGPTDSNATAARRFTGGALDPKQIKLRRDLEEVVQRDNLQYAQEMEEAMLAAQKKGSTSGAWHDFDDQNPPGNCGGGGGLGSFTARFVC